MSGHSCAHRIRKPEPNPLGLFYYPLSPPLPSPAAFRPALADALVGRSFWVIEMDYLIATGIAAAVFGGAVTYIILKMMGRL